MTVEPATLTRAVTDPVTKPRPEPRPHEPPVRRTGATSHLTAGACSYANICEQCDNYVPDRARRDLLGSQLADIIELRNDAEQRGWTEESTRHQHVANALSRHLRTIDNVPPPDPPS